MAPEVIEGRQGFREKADIWSVGVIAYELITGDRPFEAMTMEELKSIIYRKLNNLSWVENMSVSPSCKDFFRRVF